MIKRLSAGLSLVVIGAAAGLLLLEVGLRILGISSPRFFTWDYDLGFALRPNAEGWWRMEGEDYIRINSDGLRDRAHAREKPPATLRIAILGDSFSAAMQVPMEQTFWSILERELKECPVIDQQNVEVINFGVDKYGTTQELLTLRHTVWSYSPDIVILAFFTGNDIRDNSPALSNDPRPYFFSDEKICSLLFYFLSHEHNQRLCYLPCLRPYRILGFLVNGVGYVGFLTLNTIWWRIFAPKQLPQAGPKKTSVFIHHLQHSRVIQSPIAKSNS